MGIENKLKEGKPREKPGEEKPQEKPKYSKEEIEQTINKYKRREKGKGESISLESEKELKIILSYGKFGHISAGRNPSSPEDAKLTDEQINKRTEELRKDLIDIGYVFTQVRGNYGGYEDSFLVMVYDAEEKDLIVLGEKYNQESIIYVNSGLNKMIYTTGKNKGKWYEGKGWSELPPD